MTKEFEASNGMRIRLGANGYLERMNPSGTGEWNEIGGLSPNASLVYSALREFFRRERDEELGRWRWPENPDYVVQRVDHEDDGDGRCVMTISESEASVNRWWELIIQGGDGIHQEAARAYFTAHPVSKPWHDAKPGEVWLITDDRQKVFEMTVVEGSSGLEFFTHHRLHATTYVGITAARRIWPEASDA